MYNKKHLLKYLVLTFICALMAALMLCTLPACSKSTSYSKDYSDYRFELANYDVVYEISSDRTIHVTEDINVHFIGRDSTGFYRDIPINDGGIYRRNGGQRLYLGKYRHVHH
jgi:hypothetical protein